LENKITGKVLLKLDQNSLESRFGMPFGDAISFLDVITELKQSSIPPVIVTSHSTRSPAFSPAPVSGPTSEEDTSQLWYAYEKIGDTEQNNPSVSGDIRNIENYWEDNKRIALIITMAKYQISPTNVFVPLSTPDSDGEAIFNLLTKKCGFSDLAPVWLRDESTNPQNISEEFSRILKIALSAKINGKLLVFIYYSGHGTIDKQGQTCGHWTDGTSFELESTIRNISTCVNVAVISLLDCCREEQKRGGEFIKVEGKTKGQLSLIHAVPAGKSASAVIGDLYSKVTGEFLELMNHTTETYPECLTRWAKKHQTVCVTDKLVYEVKFKTISIVGPKSSPIELENMSSEDLIELLHSLNLRTDYSPVIRKERYDGRTLKDLYEEDELKILFTVGADVLTVKKHLKKMLQDSL